jgi:hypothetical protein
MGSPAAGSADAAVEGTSDADSAERPGAGEGGHRPVMQGNQLDLDSKSLLERRKALRQERKQVAKTLKNAQNTTFGTQLMFERMCHARLWKVFFETTKLQSPNSMCVTLP